MYTHAQSRDDTQVSRRLLLENRSVVIDQSL